VVNHADRLLIMRIGCYMRSKGVNHSKLQNAMSVPARGKPLIIWGLHWPALLALCSKNTAHVAHNHASSHWRPPQLFASTQQSPLYPILQPGSAMAIVHAGHLCNMQPNRRPSGSSKALYKPDKADDCIWRHSSAVRTPTAARHGRATAHYGVAASCQPHAQLSL